MNENFNFRGQQFCMDYLLAIVGANLSGLIAILAVPDILEVIYFEYRLIFSQTFPRNNKNDYL